MRSGSSLYYFIPFAIEQETPNPPSPISIDQHTVVTLTIPCTFVTMQGLICDTGFEPAWLWPLIRTIQLNPVGGCARFYWIGYQLAQSISSVFQFACCILVSNSRYCLDIRSICVCNSPTSIVLKNLTSDRL